MSIESVYQQGDDALQNMAELHFSAFNLFGIADPLKFRVTQIDIPEFAIGTYEVPWKTQKFEKPSGKDETPKTMTFTFRVDKYYTVYKALMAWWQYACNSETGAMAEDVGAISKTSNIRTDFVVKAVDSNDVVTTEGWKFNKAFIKSIAGISFDEGSGDPITVQVTMSYVTYVPLF